MRRVPRVKGIKRVPNKGKARGLEDSMSHDYIRKKTGQPGMEDSC